MTASRSFSQSDPIFGNNNIDNHAEDHAARKHDFSTYSRERDKDYHQYSLRRHTQHKCKSPDHPLPVFAKITCPDIAVSFIQAEQCVRTNNGVDASL